MKVQRLLSGWLLMVFLLAVAGCTGILTKPERPQISVASIALMEPGLFEQRFRVQLRVQNPNAFDLPIDAIQMRLDLNGQQFVTAVSAAPTTVPRYGVAMVDIDAVSTLAALLHQISEIASGKSDMVRYKLTGKVNLSRPSLSLPFTEEGEVSLAGLANGAVR